MSDDKISPYSGLSGRFIDGGEAAVKYSQRVGSRGGFGPWPIETLVLAQQLECAGKTIEEIAAELGLHVDDVREHLAPSEARRSPRPERANVGFAQLKAR